VHTVAINAEPGGDLVNAKRPQVVVWVNSSIGHAST
jgi:hypothetical protein